MNAPLPLPAALRQRLRPLARSLRWWMDRLAFALRPRKRLVVGAGGTRYRGWLHTDRDHLDLLRPDHWRRLCPADGLEAILAEHVWEHLAPGDAVIATALCFRHLRRGGRLRLAVPDGRHPDPGYIDAVKPGGSGPGASDHKVLYTHDSLCRLLADAGFEVRLLEYFDDEGVFHRQPWSAEDGFIARSIGHDARNADGLPRYTSLIVDGCKPA